MKLGWAGSVQFYVHLQNSLMLDTLRESVHMQLNGLCVNQTKGYPMRGQEEWPSGQREQQDQRRGSVNVLGFSRKKNLSLSWGIVAVGNDRSARVFAQSLQFCLTLCDPTDCSLPGSSVRGLPRQEYGSGLPYLLQGIFPTQLSSNSHLLCLLHWQAGYHQHHLGST